MITRDSILVKMARYVQAFPLRFFRFLELPLVWVLYSKKKTGKSIFVFALPRGGSTVSYQVICHALHVQYLSNLWNLFFQLPLLGGWISYFVTRRHRSNFKSEHGFVGGLDGPAEGMRFWSWWLNSDLSDSHSKGWNEHCFSFKVRYLKKVIAVLTNRRSPFLTAYLGHALIPDYVSNVFPDAVLIRIIRDPVSNALSLLKSTRASGRLWFSVVPRECYEFESCDEYERVAAQVYWLNRRLDDAADSNRMLPVRYEDLCKNPDKEIGRIREWCRLNNVSVDLRFSLPSKFELKIPDLENDVDAIRISSALNKIQKRYGKLKGCNYE